MNKLKLFSASSSILLLSLIGCTTTKIVPLKGVYENKPFEIISDTPKDQVWDKIIDFFAQNGLSIKIIDRSSGLIISDRSSLNWTFENNNGELIKPLASVVIEKIIDIGTKKPIRPSSVTGDWNIRIKQLPDNKTSINVNLLHIEATGYTIKFGEGVTQYAIKGKSTGNFEKLISDKVK
jgi:hypothetical protein